MQPTYSTAEVAHRLGVSVQTVQRWVDIGRIRAWKTLGGHRRIDADDAHALFREHEGGDQPKTAARHRPSLLVVDDSDIDREVITMMLMAALPNAVLSSASSGFEALLMVGRQSFDALVTDIAMPNMNGFEMLRYLSQAGSQRPRHLLATSSSSLLQLRRLGTLPPGVTFMRKPLGATDLSAWLASRFPADSRPTSSSVSRASSTSR